MTPRRSAIWMCRASHKLCNFFNEPWIAFTGRTREQELGNGWGKAGIRGHQR